MNKIRTLDDLAEAIVTKIHEHDRHCQCKTCHKQCLQCLDCSACRGAITEKVLILMRSANAPP